MIILNNKGFSLVELIAVLAILTAVLAIAIPSVTSSLNRGEEQDLEKRKQIILSEAELKLNDEQLTMFREGKTIKISELVSENIITESQSRDKNGNPIEGCIGYNINYEIAYVDCVE